jgi:ubiquitin-like protein Nedd8
MQIYVKTLTGRKLLFDIEETDALSILRDKVMESEGIDASQIRMIHNGSQVNFTQTFDKTKIKSGDTIHLVLALRGG